MKRIITSYWTVGIIGLAGAAAHAWWLARSRHCGEVVSGYGAFLVVLGLVVAARPFIRLGVLGFTRQQIPMPGIRTKLLTESSTIESSHTIHERKVAAAFPDVIAERVVAVLVVVIGTLLNGYGSPIARVLGWPT